MELLASGTRESKPLSSYIGSICWTNWKTWSSWNPLSSWFSIFNMNAPKLPTITRQPSLGKTTRQKTQNERLVFTSCAAGNMDSARKLGESRVRCKECQDANIKCSSSDDGNKCFNCRKVGYGCTPNTLTVYKVCSPDYIRKRKKGIDNIDLHSER